MKLLIFEVEVVWCDWLKIVKYWFEVNSENWCMLGGVFDYDIIGMFVCDVSGWLVGVCMMLGMVFKMCGWVGDLL